MNLFKITQRSKLNYSQLALIVSYVVCMTSATQLSYHTCMATVNRICVINAVGEVVRLAVLLFLTAGVPMTAK